MIFAVDGLLVVGGEGSSLEGEAVGSECRVSAATAVPSDNVAASSNMSYDEYRYYLYHIYHNLSRIICSALVYPSIYFAHL